MSRTFNFYLITKLKNIGIAGSLLLLMAFGCISTASAYNLLGNKWPQPSTTFYVSIPGENGLWDDAFEGAMYEWSAATVFQFNIFRGTYSDPCDPSDNNNGVGFSSTSCGDAWGDATLAICYSWRSGSTTTETDIVFNSNVSWDVYSTSWQYSVSDFKRVAVHELGHVLGLDHEDSIPLTIMGTYVGDITTPQQDDINGVAAMYGPACTYSIAPSSGSFTSSGGDSTISVTASSTSCAWTASESLSWVSLSSTSGTGSGSVIVTVNANTGAARSGVITIADKTYTVSQTEPVNLTPYKPDGWSDKIVTSTITDTNVDSSVIYETDTIYVNWAVKNNGDIDAGSFTTTLYIDENLTNFWSHTTGLQANHYDSVLNYSIGSLSVGPHTIKIVTDSDENIAESNETDNDYTKMITITNNSGIFSNTYYLPVFKPQPNYWSGLGITNLCSTSSANVVVTVYNQNGALLTTDTKTIEPQGQDNFLVGAGLNSDGWIKVTSDQQLAGLNFLGQYEENITDYYLGDVPFTETLSKSLVIPHVAQNATWDTTVFLANPNPSMATVTLIYHNKSGTASTPVISTIPANGSQEISVGTIGNSNSIKGGCVTISSTQGLTAFALYNNLKTNNYSFAGINAVDASNSVTVSDYYLPVFKPQPSFWSGFGITNLSKTNDANVIVTVYNQNGSLLATDSKTLAPQGQDSFLIGTSLNSDGWMKVTSDQQLAGLNFLGQYNENITGYYLGDVPFAKTLSKMLIIPHVAQNATWDTTVFLANPNTSGATVILTYTNKKGGLESTPYHFYIGPNQSREISVSTIVPGDSIKGGSVTISSTQGLTAFGLYNNLKTGNYSYAGINAVDISE